ncbi:MAG: segregation/condensation protein A [bacterium]|nr:segregation/condensation protein A [bacterium]
MLPNKKQVGDYTLEMEQFSGPMHLLLELIEKEELPITEVSLAKVTESYLKHLDENDVPVGELADFLVVATRLLYLKSKQLLPDLKEEEEEPANQLASQLRLYQLFVGAAKHIEASYSQTSKMHVRTKALLPKPEFVGFPERLVPSILEGSFHQLMKTLQPFLALRQTSVERVRSVGERMEELRQLIRTRAKVVFSELTSGTKSKMDVVVSFLALLELVKQRTVSTKQSALFEDITISRV